MSLSGSMVQETKHLLWNQWSELKTVCQGCSQGDPLQE